MDLALYVSSIQDRMFIALAGLIGAFALDLIRGGMFGHRADPRPLLERLADMLLFPLASRLNRAGRSDGALVMRGMMVLTLGCVLFFAVIAGGLVLARHYGQGGVYLAIVTTLSVSAAGWFAPLRALARMLADPKSPRPYMVLARASYSNLVTLDESGIIRVSVTAAIRSVVMRMAAPLMLFIFCGWQVLAIYWPIMMLALATGQDGKSRSFAALTNLLATLLLFVPTLAMFPLVLAALFFSAGSSFFRALPGFFRVTRWPPFLQGGLPLLVVAYAMKLTLGGPRQDRAGAGVMAQWVGPDKGTARLESRDIGRVLYFQGVSVLLSAVVLYAAIILL